MKGRVVELARCQDGYGSYTCELNQSFGDLGTGLIAEENESGGQAGEGERGPGE
jgi:hypothetical protein